MSHYGTELVQGRAHSALRKHLLADPENMGKRWANGDEDENDQKEGAQNDGIMESGTKAILQLMMAKYTSRGDGKMTTHELRALMKDVAQGVEPTDEEVEGVLGKVNVDSDGLIESSLLLNAMSYWMISVQKKNSAGGSCECVIC
ncbi:hypothetical protein CEUSTIGMA_g2725.t1 [Chlamydomonas eustigma]|uniref:EF-hand domain-containing protein n=1 Tax=Chlamydomonas eustigma TaxID=1157962 RepID=A0A250WXM1_9CHLO|nr:hypothetical protein CEUSTIGMA_g2725.t1 [Chlamydomonas eustigma]|eukprot:GAX75280.1 hypothetical protein CEUSTIGMA_g2725.t1 [Chlamydomonas eustigma]